MGLRNAFFRVIGIAMIVIIIATFVYLLIFVNNSTLKVIASVGLIYFITTIVVLYTSNRNKRM
ncbi:hypothetical protein KTT_20090 [Tengunoibacter tsumagoiensis]|uniref:Uncharacterized protein n=1 Tax=Tengunoibacter tsumagoiensis TaxID=2014871 RepID=A0A401ZZ82_9CHLR|nr:hypothetical protein KTT_20090 [Tengunoibacter tsumagoiensis]